MDVDNAASEPIGGLGADEVAVVLQRRAAPGAVDEDRSVAGHRCHHRDGHGSGVAPEPGMDCERTTASGPASR